MLAKVEYEINDNFPEQKRCKATLRLYVPAKNRNILVQYRSTKELFGEKLTPFWGSSVFIEGLEYRYKTFYIFGDDWTQVKEKALYLLDVAKQILLNASFDYVDILSTKPEDQSFSF